MPRRGTASEHTQTDYQHAQPTGFGPGFGLGDLFSASFRAQFRSPLCWRITAFVFGAIILIEAIILVPSIANERRAQTLEREVTALAVARAAFRLTPANAPIDQVIAALDRASDGTPLVGGTLFSIDGEWLATFGEAPRPSAAAPPARYAVKWSEHDLGANFRMVSRLNTGGIGDNLWRYVFDIGALVLVISIFVTAATMYMVGRVILRPLLELRENLQSLSGNGADRRAHHMIAKHKDEWGDVVAAFNAVLNRTSAIEKNTDDKKR